MFLWSACTATKDMATWLTEGTSFEVASFARSRRTPFQRIQDRIDRCFLRFHHRRRHRQNILRSISPVRRSAYQKRRRQLTMPRWQLRPRWCSECRRQGRATGSHGQSFELSSDIGQPSISTHTLHTYWLFISLTSLPLPTFSGPPATNIPPDDLRDCTRWAHKTFNSGRSYTVTWLSS